MTELSSKGQAIVPKVIQGAYHWEAGQKLAIDMGNGILLKPKKPISETTLDSVAGCLRYQRTPQSLEDMENVILKGVRELWQHGYR